MSVLFKYGDYRFRPAPLLTINMEPVKSSDHTGHGIVHTISLEGTIILTGTEVSGGAPLVFSKIDELRAGLDQEGRLLVASCNNEPLISGRPSIEGISIDGSRDNYTRTANYKVEFKMDGLVVGSGSDRFNQEAPEFPPYIESKSESWEIDFLNERMPFSWTLSDGTTEGFGYQLSVTHSVDVKARVNYTGNDTGTPKNNTWEDAKNYATSLLGFDSTYVSMPTIINFTSGNYGVYNNYRQVSNNVTEGSIQVTETFVASASGSNLPQDAIETFDISSSQSEGITTISINGEIQGLFQADYSNSSGLSVTSSKFSAASGYYNIIKNRIYDRAKTAYSGINSSDSCFYRPLNPTVVSRTVGMNPIEGTISYDYEYNTATQGCITGSCLLSQSISIDDTLATDVFASHTIIGRTFGPILQDINTITARVRTVNVELVTLAPTGCSSIAEMYKPVPTGAVNDFISVVSGDLVSNYGQVFVSTNSQNWAFTNGRYTRNIGFTYNTCSG